MNLFRSAWCSRFAAVMSKNPSLNKRSRFPVERVAVADILKFCRNLCQIKGVTVRLPTEAEWEYTAQERYYPGTRISELPGRRPDRPLLIRGILMLGGARKLRPRRRASRQVTDRWLCG